MKVILRDPPLFLLLAAIALDLPVQRSEVPRPRRKQGWLSRQLDQFLAWRDSLTRDA